MFSSVYMFNVKILAFPGVHLVGNIGYQRAGFLWCLGAAYMTFPLLLIDSSNMTYTVLVTAVGTYHPSTFPLLLLDSSNMTYTVLVTALDPLSILFLLKRA